MGEDSSEDQETTSKAVAISHEIEKDGKHDLAETGPREGQARGGGSVLAEA